MLTVRTGKNYILSFTKYYRKLRYFLEFLRNLIILVAEQPFDCSGKLFRTGRIAQLGKE
jgi:hypothetical protein